MASKEENLQFKVGCLLNLEGIDLDTPIYRVFPIERLLQFFNEKKNTLVKPAMWDDPFENVIYQQTAIYHTGETIYFDNIRECFYGQCWTLNTEETDALWRIYSPSKNGIRVKTTLKKLWDTFYNDNDPNAMISYYLGKMIYESEPDIKAFLEDPVNLKSMILSSGKESVQSLLIKRNEFKHEDEVRIIYFGQKEHYDLKKNIFQYNIDPNELIDELFFDPRFDKGLYNAMVNEFKRLGFNKTINQSKLYQLPKYNLRLNL